MNGFGQIWVITLGNIGCRTHALTARCGSVSNDSNKKSQECGNLILWLFFCWETKLAFSHLKQRSFGNMLLRPKPWLAVACLLLLWGICGRGEVLRVMTDILCSLGAVGGPPALVPFSVPHGVCQQETFGCIFQACLAKGVWNYKNIEGPEGAKEHCQHR